MRLSERIQNGSTSNFIKKLNESIKLEEKCNKNKMTEEDENLKTQAIGSITQEAINGFNKLKNLFNSDEQKEELDGFYFPKKAIQILKDSNKEYHLNQYMDLKISDILNMIEDNDNIEGAINDLFDEYDESSAFSWSDNFITALSSLVSDDIEEYTDDVDEGCKNEACKNEGCKNEGCKNEGCKNEACKNEACKNEACKNEACKNEGCYRKKSKSKINEEDSTIQDENIQKLKDTLEQDGWDFYTDNYNGGIELEIHKYSPAGEDFFFNVFGKNSTELIENIIRYTNEFDADEHAMEVKDMEGAPSIRELLKDADKIRPILQNKPETDVNNETNIEDED